MQRFLSFFLVLLLVSCEYFNSREKQTEQMVSDELMSIDWNDVDGYPLFENCDENADKKSQRDCFQKEMLLRFKDTLSSLQLTSVGDFNDTLIVDFKIDEDGFVTIFEIKENSTIQDAFPGLEEEISNRLNDLTTVAPAHKRSTPVSMKFRLPIVLNTSN